MPYREKIIAERSLVTGSRTCLGALCERLRAVKHNVASALRANRVYVCERSHRSGQIDQMPTEGRNRVTYMNKGGTAERIGPCFEGLIVPAVLYFYMGIAKCAHMTVNGT